MGGPGQKPILRPAAEAGESKFNFFFVFFGSLFFPFLFFFFYVLNIFFKFEQILISCRF
jgi:hypothetical protein